MPLRRRALFAQVMSTALLNLLLASRGEAEEVTYEYDALGRLKKVTYGDGTTTAYTYDPAGNRTAVQTVTSQLPPLPPQTIAVTGTGPVNLRTLANNAGYNGQDANFTFEVNSGVVIAGAAGNPNGGLAIDTGTWPIGSYSVSLTLLVKNGGAVQGGGGHGGGGGGEGTSIENGSPGGVGGDAVNCQVPMTITVNSGGSISSGGGGGGGGGGGYSYFDEYSIGGGGGGGGFPNGNGGSAGGSLSIYPGVGGTSGTTGGGGGAGGNNGSGFSGGYGGAGGGAGAAGSSGIASGQGGQGGAGGAAGYAIRKNGHVVNMTNNGTVTGLVG